MSTYDLAVVGAGLGGLAAAALFSAKGKKVLVSSPHASLAEALGAVAADGFRFSSGPALLHGFEPGGAFNQFFHAAGIHDWEPAHAAVYQVALPDRRITVFSNQEETLDELRREFPREIQSLIKFSRDLSKAAVLSAQNRVAAFIAKHWSSRAFIRNYKFSAELGAFLDVQARYFFQRPCNELSLETLITLCTRKPAAITAGYGKLAERLAEVLHRRGGEIRLSEPSREIVFHGNRAKGIGTAQGVVDAGTVLLCSSEKSMPSLFLGIRDEVVPVGMERNVLYLPDYARPHDVLACSLSAKDDTSAAPEGMRTLVVTFHGSSDQLRDSGSRTDRLSGLVPFLDDFLVLTRDFRPSETAAAPPGLSLKPLQSRVRGPLLFKGSKGNVYLLHEARHAPLQVISAARKFVEKTA
ncbi:MAG TPA: NAD(P)-binding protein [Nitrospirota bacterium]|nr:NAD(P)-binding protein [Nitrospirota bacterium]